MTVCYNKLWKLLIDKNMKKKDLRLAAGISTTALAKLGKNEHVNTEILTKICKAMDCDFCDTASMARHVGAGAEYAGGRMQSSGRRAAHAGAGNAAGNGQG